MKAAIILSVGYHHYAFPVKKGRAGELLELFAEAVPVNSTSEKSKVSGEWCYRLEPKKCSVKIEIISGDSLLMPKKEEMEEADAVDLRSLPGGLKLIGGGK